jgi:tetratricopeptide (TPR) repeat protein
MIKKVIKISAFGLALFAAHSCNDQLEITDPNRLSTGSFYKTQDHAIAAVDAIYNVMIIDGMYQRITPATNDGRSDEIYSRGGFSAWELPANFIAPTTEVFMSFIWRDHYIMANRANQALERIPTIPEVDEALRSRLLGQAYFLRALAYFDLTNFFEIPPLVLRTYSGEDQSELYPSNKDITQADIYLQVELDLTQAIGLLPDSYSTVTGPDNGHVGRATRGAARSLMGKVLLYQGKHAEALPYFKDVVDSQIYNLGNYFDLISQDPAVEASVPERIFWVEFTQSTNPNFNWGGDPNTGWRQFSALAPTYSIADFGDYGPTDFLLNEMKEELTIDGKLDPRYRATILSYEPTEGDVTGYGRPWVETVPPGENAADYFVRPFDLKGIKKYTLASTGGDWATAGMNYHLIRFADVLLMYAECLANTGNIPAAATQVQRVRNRANLPDREAEFATYTLPQFMEQLAHERIMELPIEGSRWYDIKRWGWLDDPTRLDQLKQNDPEFQNFVPSRKYIAVPQAELDVNPNLVGNTVNLTN